MKIKLGTYSEKKLPQFFFRIKSEIKIEIYNWFCLNILSYCILQCNDIVVATICYIIKVIKVKIFNFFFWKELKNNNLRGTSLHASCLIMKARIYNKYKYFVTNRKFGVVAEIGKGKSL
jgi:hypothetical protein